MQLRGSLLRDVSGAPVGRVQTVLLQPDTKDARWLSVRLESGAASVLVPAAAVSEFAPGELIAPYPAQLIAAATHDAGQSLSSSAATVLLQHYGFETAEDGRRS